MKALLADKVTIVTGAASGIGRAASFVLARAGAKLLLADVSPQGEQTAEEVRAQGGEATFVQTDIAHAEQVQRMVDHAVSRFGRLDCAFNNAGIAGASELLTDQTEQTWRQVLDINVIGTWLCLKYEIPAMLRAGGGTIVNTSSNAALQGLRTMAPYVASKHAVLGLTRNAALEFAARNIRVNAICPGIINTPPVRASFGLGEGADYPAHHTFAVPTAMGRLGLPEEVGELALWLLCPKSSYITGQACSIDGGMTAGPTFAT
jgi:NAD(P)-dependent dehydrogenase (short-subunit alcohol dehydrogenase family)